MAKTKAQRKRKKAIRVRVKKRVVHWLDQVNASGDERWSIGMSFFDIRDDRRSLTLCGKRVWSKKDPLSPRLLVRSIDGTYNVTTERSDRRSCLDCQRLANMEPQERAAVIAARNAKKRNAFEQLKVKTNAKREREIAELRAQIDEARPVAHAALDAFELRKTGDYSAWHKLQRCGYVVTGPSGDSIVCDREARHDGPHKVTHKPAPDVHEIIALAVSAIKLERGSRDRGKNPWVSRAGDDNTRRPGQRPMQCDIHCRFCGRTLAMNQPLGGDHANVGTWIVAFTGGAEVCRTVSVEDHAITCALRYLAGEDYKTDREVPQVES